MAEANVGVIINAQDNATATLNKITKTVKSLEPAFKTAAIAGGVAFGAISLAIKDSLDSAADAAKVQAQLTAVLASTHGAAGLYIDDLNDQAKALEHMTTYSDEAVNSAQSMLLTFTQVKGPVFQNAIGTILDMSTALGQDLQSSAIQVGKALNNPTIGITALQRVGVSFSESQKDVINKLVETGHLAEAQTLILKELNTEFGGSAQAAAGTFAGKLAQMNEQFDDMKENVGNALVPALMALAKAVGPIVAKFAEWAEKHPKLLAAIVLITAATTGLITIVGALGLALAGLASTAVALNISLGLLLGWMALIPIAIAAVIAVGYLLYAHWGEISQFAGEVWAGIVAYVEEAWGAIVGVFTTAKDAVLGVWTSFTSALSEAWQFTWLFIQEFVKNTLGLIVGSILVLLDTFIPNWRVYLETILSVITEVFTAIYTFVTDIWNSTIDAVSGTMLTAGKFISDQFQSLKAVITSVLKAISGIWHDVWSGISAFFGDIWNAITDKLKEAVSYIETQIKRLTDLVAPVSKALGSTGGALSKAFSSVINTGRSALHINDGIVQNGQVISTHPDDYIIATKNPASLAGAGGININISGAVFSQDAARTLGDIIFEKLQQQRKI